MNEMSPLSPPLTALEYYNLIRNRIEHEDNLIVQRLSWMVASQSFLFTAYAIVLNGLTAPVQAFVEQQRLLFRLIPAVAILTCVLIYISILAAVRAIGSLRRSYRSRFGQEERDLPGIQTDKLTRRLGMAAPALLPLVFIAVWLFLWTRGMG
jgi:hypothetical protein